MTHKAGPYWSCNGNSGGFPVISTVIGVASCFAEPFLKKHFALGSGVEVAVGIAQAVPFAIVLRYFAARVGIGLSSRGPRL